MDMMSSEEKDIVVDVESCANDVVENVCNVGEGKTYLNKFWSCYINCDGLNRGEEAECTEKRLLNCVEGQLENGGPLVVGKMIGEDEKVVAMLGAEKHKKKGCKKPPKPPRPPRPMSLDSADEKLIREISELAILRRARIDRMKALKKVKNGKAASSSAGSAFALVVTLVFCVVIIWQGVFPRGSSTNAFQGSPLLPMGSTPSSSSSSSFMSIKFNSNASAIAGSS